MTLVSPETLCGEQGPAVGGVRRCSEQKRATNCVSPGLMVLIILEAWQVAGNVGCARSMVIGKCEARFKPERVCPA